MRWRAPGWRSRRGNAAVLLLLGLLLADLVPRVRLLVGRRCLVLGPVELLLTLLSRRAVRMFRTAGYGAGAAAVIRSAIHRSVIHRPSLRRRPRSSRSFLSSLFFPLLSFFLSLSFSFSTSTCASSSLLSYIPARPIVRLSLSLSCHVDRRVLEIRDRLGTNGTGQRILSDRSLPPLFAATMILTRSAAETSRREKSGRSRIDRSAESLASLSLSSLVG